MATVPYLQVEFSFVVIERAVDVVPEDNAPVGEPADLVGAVVSATEMALLTSAENELSLFEVS